MADIVADICRRAGLVSGGSVLTLIGYAVFGPVGALVGGFLGGNPISTEGHQGTAPQRTQHSAIDRRCADPARLWHLCARWKCHLVGRSNRDQAHREEGGFLGIGGQEITNYSYSIDLAIGICEGPIDGIRRIWADADLIYDASDDETLYERFLGGEVDTSTFLEEIATTFAEVLAGIRAMSAQLNFELYLGTEDQLPDPTIQEYENVGYVVNVVPAYRGLAYIVFNDFQLEKFGNRIPNFRFEVVSNGTAVECGAYTGGHLEPWLPGVTQDPRNYLNVHQYHSGDAGAEWHDTIEAALAEVGDGDFVLDYEIPGNSSPPTVKLWISEGGNQASVCDGMVLHPPMSLLDRYKVRLSINHFPMDLTPECGPITWFSGFANSFVATFGTGNLVWWTGRTTSSDTFRGYHVAILDEDLENGASPLDYFDGHAPEFSGHAEIFDATHFELLDASIYVRRSPQPKCEYPLEGGWCITNGVLTPSYIEVSGTFHVLREYRTSTVSIDPQVVLGYPLDPCIRNDSPFYNDEAFWTAAYNDAVAAGDMEPGLVYGEDYPETTNTAYFAECDQIDAECVPMAVIVSDIARRAGLLVDTSGSQVDVSDLTTCVTGYVVGRQMSARDALQPLRMFGLWDAVESGAVLKFIERGHAIAETLTSDDLGRA